MFFNKKNKSKIKGRGLRFKQRGASLVEFVVVFPVFVLLGLGVYQYIVIAEVKATLNHATFMGARKGSLYNADIDMIQGAIAEYMAPIYAPESGSTLDMMEKSGPILDGKCTIASMPHERIGGGPNRVTCHDLLQHAQIKIINPTREAFEDFSEDIDGNGTMGIPSVDLNTRSIDNNTSSGLNIQDANLLKIEVVYAFETRVPFAGWVIPAVMRKFTPAGSFEDQQLAENRIPLRASSVVRMQTPTFLNDAMLTRAEAEGKVEELLTSSIAQPNIPSRPWCGGPTGEACSTVPVQNPCGG